MVKEEANFLNSTEKLDKMPLQTDEYQNFAEKEFAEWEKDFKEKLKEHYNEKLPIVHPCFSIGEKTAKSLMTWCAKNGDSASDLPYKLHYLSRFIIELYDVLALPQDGSAASNRRYGFWSHVDLDNICLHKPKSYRELFIDRQLLKSLADNYLAYPWLQNSFLDWVFVDVLIASESIATFEWFQAQRGGVSYALFEGNKIKAALFRIFVATPSIFFLSWIMPGLLFWWLYGTYPNAALVIGVLYYVINIAWVIVYCIRLMLHRLRGGKSLRQKAAEIIPALYNTYQELRDPTVHVPSLRRAVEQAKEKGVVWGAQLFCILDNVAQAHPSTWTSR